MGCAVCRHEHDAAMFEYDVALAVEQDLYAKLSFHRDACLKFRKYAKRHDARYFDDADPVGKVDMDLRNDWERALLEWQTSSDALLAAAARRSALFGMMMDEGCDHA